MNKNVTLERELYPDMEQWLRDYLKDNYKGYEIFVRTTSEQNLDVVLDEIGVLKEYPNVIGIGIQIDVLGVARRKDKTLLFFIEAKKTALNTHDLGQILIYSLICKPEKAFLFSSAGVGSLGRLLHEREDIAIYDRGKRLKMVQAARWDIVRKSPDPATTYPKTT